MGALNAVIFQSTPSHGGRRLSINKTSYTNPYFNPLPHTEGDSWVGEILRAYGISIHSLTRRETGIRTRKGNLFENFNPLPHTEGDIIREQFSWANIISIHSLTRRETFSGRINCKLHNYFNPLPHTEGDILFSPFLCL